MYTPEFQFVKLSESLEEGCCGLCLPVSAGGDVKFQYHRDAEEVPSLEIKNTYTSELAAKAVWNVWRQEFYRNSIMSGLTHKDIAINGVANKAGVSMNMFFEKKNYLENGTSEDTAIDNVTVEVVDDNFTQDTGDGHEIPDVLVDYTDAGTYSSPLSLTDILISLNNYEDDAVIISNNKIKAKSGITLKLAQFHLQIGWTTSNLPPHDWNINSFTIKVAGVEYTSSNIVNNTPAGDGWVSHAWITLPNIVMSENEEIDFKFSYTSAGSNIVDWTVDVYVPTDISIIDGRLFSKIEVVNDEDVLITSIEYIRNSISLDDKYFYTLPITAFGTTSNTLRVKFYEIDNATSTEVLSYTTDLFYYSYNSDWINNMVFLEMPFYTEELIGELLPDNTEGKKILVKNTGDYDIESGNYTLEVGKYYLLYFENSVYQCVEVTDVNFNELNIFKLYLATPSGIIITEITNCVYDETIYLQSFNLNEFLAIGDCFRLVVVDESYNKLYTNIFTYIGCETEGTVVLHYWCQEDTFGFIAYPDGDARQGVKVRLNMYIRNPQFPQVETVYEKLNGDRVILSSTIKEEKELETDYMPELYHKYLVIALGHDQITFDDIRMIKSDTYEIGEDYYDDSCENRYRKASAKLQYNITHRNANIGALGVES